MTARARARRAEHTEGEDDSVRIIFEGNEKLHRLRIEDRVYRNNVPPPGTNFWAAKRKPNYSACYDFVYRCLPLWLNTDFLCEYAPYKLLDGSKLDALAHRVFDIHRFTYPYSPADYRVNDCFRERDAAILRIELPFYVESVLPHELFFFCEREGAAYKNALFAVENDAIYPMPTLGGVEPDGSHNNYGMVATRREALATAISIFGEKTAPVRA